MKLDIRWKGKTGSTSCRGKRCIDGIVSRNCVGRNTRRNLRRRNDPSLCTVQKYLPRYLHSLSTGSFKYSCPRDDPDISWTRLALSISSSSGPHASADSKYCYIVVELVVYLHQPHSSLVSARRSFVPATGLVILQDKTQHTSTSANFDHEALPHLDPLWPVRHTCSPYR